MLSGGGQHYIESLIPGPFRLINNQTQCIAASLVGAAHQLKEYAQPHRLCGTTHSRRDLDNAECIRRLSVPVGWRNKIGASALAKPDSFDLGGRVPADTADMATGEDRSRAGQADVPVLGRMIDCPQGIGHTIQPKSATLAGQDWRTGHGPSGPSMRGGFGDACRGHS